MPDKETKNTKDTKDTKPTIEEMYWELVSKGFLIQSSEKETHSLLQPNYARIVETFVTYGAYEDPI